MTSRVAAVIVAAGRGYRAGGEMPKQYREIAGEPVIRPTLAAFLGHAEIDAVQPVIHPDDEQTFRTVTGGLKGLLPPVPGGATRQASVRAGLEALQSKAPDIVLIHDAARPFLSGALIARAIAAARAHGAAVPAVAITDTVKRIDERDIVSETLDRSRLRTVQTPQAFAFDLIMDFHHRAAAAGREDFTDDAALAEWAGHSVSVFEGEATNVKLTTNDDFARAEALRAAALADVRTGNGFDVHVFGDGDHVMLGGVRIPHTPRCNRTLGRRRGAACPGRRHSRRARRRRYRRSLSAERPAVAGSIVGSLSRLRLRARPRPRRHDRASRRHGRLRDAAHRTASRCDARAHRRDRWNSRSDEWRSRRRPARSSASPAAAKASWPWRPRLCGCRGAPRDQQEPARSGDAGA